MRKISKRGRKEEESAEIGINVCAYVYMSRVCVCVRVRSKTCPFGAIRDLEPPLGNAFSLNEFCNEAPRQTLS